MLPLHQGPRPKLLKTMTLKSQHLFNKERETRLEFATSCLEGRNSNQLSYSRKTIPKVSGKVPLAGFEPTISTL